MTSPSSRASAARDRRRLARPPRLPRAAEDRSARRGRPPGERARRLRRTSCSRCGTPSGPPRCSSASTRSTSPTYRNEALPGLPVGARVRGRDRRAARGPARRSSTRSASRSRRRRATRPTTSWPRRPRPGPGPVLVVTSDRDAFQLVSDRVTVLQPVEGRERARADRARPRCARATGSSRRRCRTSSRCAATRPTASRARAGSGRRRRRTCSAQYGTLEAALEAGRFAPIADDLRLYRRDRTMDAAAPLPRARRQTSPTGRAPRRRRASSA